MSAHNGIHTCLLPRFTHSLLDTHVLLGRSVLSKLGVDVQPALHEEAPLLHWLCSLQFPGVSLMPCRYHRYAAGKFVGAVIVISSMGAIPVVVIVRLIALPEAQEQASQYIQEVLEWAQETRASARRYLFAHCHAYKPQVDDNGTTGSNVPYQAANRIIECQPFGERFTRN